MNPANASSPTKLDQPGLLSEAQFIDLAALIYARSGLFFGEQKKFLVESRLRKRMGRLGLASPADYLVLLGNPLRGGAELTQFLDVVTTHETFFFRDPQQLDVFSELVLPRVLGSIEQAGNRRMDVWSAACSSGEEPYSLAMLLLEALGGNASRWDLSVLGTDLAPSVIERAEAATYGEYSLRKVPTSFVRRYFQPAPPDSLRVKEAVRDLVRFRLLNFADDVNMRRLRGFHVIFCRNALIYFDKASRRRLVDHFYRALQPGGYLFVGHAESLHGISNQFKLVHFPGTMAYLKPE